MEPGLGRLDFVLAVADLNGDGRRRRQRERHPVSVTYPEDHGTIHIGDQVQFQATVSSGAGTQAAAKAAWQSDAPAVATVSSSGLVTGVSAARRPSPPRFGEPPNFAWTVRSGPVSIDGTLTLTSDEVAFRLPENSVEIQARLTSYGQTFPGS